jgi:pyruvate kinase
MNYKQVKIVATLGPASDTYETILEMAKAGVNVFRINLSHAGPDEIDLRFKAIRKAEKELGQPLTIMGDLAGAKIRIEDVEDNITLEKGDKVTIVSKHIKGDKTKFSLNFPSIIKFIEEGATIYIDDGAIKLRAIKKNDQGIEAIVVVGGKLLPRKGFLAEGIALHKMGVSDKDKNSIKLMIEKGVDALAISFVQTAEDVLEVRKLLPKNSQIRLVAKIETQSGVDNAESILEEVDILMVARGDLGLSVPMAKIPHIQKRLIKLCLKKAKPVITATQMLESMISRSIPTRAEVTDVANAILDGTDAVMLSAETASGLFPVETIETMVKIISETLLHLDHIEFNEEGQIGDAVSASAGNIADQIDAKLVIALTEKGTTARKISRHRHKFPVLALSNNDATIHALNFSWGVYPHKVIAIKEFEQMKDIIKDIAKKNRILNLKKGDKYVITAGIPYGQSGSTNLIYVDKI